MDTTTTNLILKMRFRLPNGEEFEAEGTREFIESQRNYFLALIGCHTTATPAAPNQQSSPEQLFANPKHTEQYAWEQVIRQDNETLLFRKKPRLTIAEAAILLIAAARILLQKNSYSALELAKSLKASGIAGGRLDRALTTEIQSGNLTPQGSKRSRTYHLSDGGLAKAYTLLERLANK